MGSHSCQTIRLLAFAATIALFASTAAGQLMGWVENPEEAILPPEILDQYEEILELNEDEAALFESVLAAQQKEFQRVLARINALQETDQELTRRLYPDGDFSKRPEGPKAEEHKAAGRRIDARKLELAREVMEFRSRARADLRNILSEERQERWDRLMRDSRRTRTIINNSRFIGEPVDLVYVVDELDLNTDALDGLLEEYAKELDEPLRKRNAIIRESLFTHYEKMQSGAYEFREEHDRRRRLYAKARTPEERELVSEMLDREARERRAEEKRPRLRAHKAVRDINLRYLDLIRMQLSPEEDASFMALYRRYAYRDYPIFSPYRLEADRFFDAIIADESIDAAKRAEIEALRDEEYVPRRDELNLALADAYERWELRWEERILETLDPSYEERIRRLHDQRRALQERVIRDVVRLLPDEALEEHTVPEEIKDEPEIR